MGGFQLPVGPFAVNSLYDRGHSNNFLESDYLACLTKANGTGKAKAAKRARGLLLLVFARAAARIAGNTCVPAYLYCAPLNGSQSLVWRHPGFPPCATIWTLGYQ
jgi:hypothetical protein